MKHLYKSHSKLYSIVIMCLCLCEMHIKAVRGYVQLCIKFVEQWNKRFDLRFDRKNTLLKNFRHIPQEMKILYQEQFLHKNIQ